MGAVFCFLLFLAAVGLCILLGQSLILAIWVGIAAFAALGLRRGMTVRAMWDAAWEQGRKMCCVIVIYMLIGAITALWRSAGTIAFFIYHGLRIITPQLFLLVTFLLTSFISYALGTSFGVVGTLGVILMALARSGGVSVAITAGTIVAGAYFGDRCSPASSSATLVAAATDTKLYDNLHMMHRTGWLPYLVSLAAYAALSVTHPLTMVDSGVLDQLSGTFSLSWWTAIPALLILILPLCKVPIRPTMAVSALTALRCGAAKANPVDAAGWLQNVAGLENILVLEKNGQPAAMLAAVPVKYGQHRGVWLCGAAGVQGVPMDRLLPKIMEGCLRAYGASGFDFAVTTPDDARRAEDLKTLGFKSQLPLRVIQTPIRRDLFAQAAFDSLTVHKLLKRRHIYQPGCISLPEEAMNETMTQLYRRGLTVVSTRRGYGLYFTKGDTLQFLELQADNDHCADQLLQAAREKTGAANARILLAENQTLYLGSGRRCGYGMIAFLGRPFSVTDAYFRMLL